MSTFVSVGNATQSFNRLLQAVAQIAPSLPQPVVVQHGHTPFKSCSCSTVSFMDMADFEDHVAGAELLILHAGAGSVLTAVRLGKIPVLACRRVHLGEHVDDHQCEFAQLVASAGKAVVADDLSRLPDYVQMALQLQKEASVGTSSSLMISLVAQALERATGRG